jgi:hypothetical protein
VSRPAWEEPPLPSPRWWSRSGHGLLGLPGAPGRQAQGRGDAGEQTQEAWPPRHSRRWAEPRRQTGAHDPGPEKARADQGSSDALSGERPEKGAQRTRESPPTESDECEKGGEEVERKDGKERFSNGLSLPEPIESADESPPPAPSNLLPPLGVVELGVARHGLAWHGRPSCVAYRTKTPRGLEG